MTDSQDSVSSRDYIFLMLLMMLNIMNFVDRQLLASFANFIKPELALTDTQFGLLTGLVFIFFYSIMGLFMGALADMLHRPRLVAFGVGLWSILTALSGAARGFISLAIPRMFIGVGESILTPTAMSMLSDRFPANRMGFASGVYYMGVPIGVGASMLVAGFLGPAIGWRNCFYLLGAIGLVFAGVMLFIKDPPRKGQQQPANKPDADDNRTGETPKVGARDLIRILFTALRNSPALVLTIAGGVFLHFILGAAAFDQLWYVEERGFERAYILQVTGWIAVVGGVMGNLFGGLGSDWFLRRTGQGRAMFLFWIMLVLAPLNIMYRVVPGESMLFWVGVFFAFFQLGCFYGPTFSTVQELVPPQIRASVVAFYILTLNLVGLGIGVTLGGISIDWMRDNGFAEPYSTTLLVFTLLSCLAIPCFYFAGRRFAADRARLLASV